jgi:uncharacterized protein YfbU (UPF0304 family)
MNLTKTERLILANQYRILEKLYPNESSYSNAAEIVTAGYTRLYRELPNQPHEEIPPAVCEEVTEILEMYRALHPVCDKSFPGFDGNDEVPHYSYARFMIEDMGRWIEFKDDDINSHTAMLPTYQAMLREWEASPSKVKLTEDDAARILKAGEDA